MNTNDQNLPPRFRASNVDRFVPVLKKVLEGRPNIRFKNSEIGLNWFTATSRFRDAARAVIYGHQFYPDVDADKLRDVWPLYKVDYDHNSKEVVVVRHKSNQTVTNIDTVLELIVRTEEPEFEEYITHLAWLYGHNKFRGFVTILGMLDETLIQRLMTEYNVFIRQGDCSNEHIMN